MRVENLSEYSNTDRPGNQ